MYGRKDATYDCRLALQLLDALQWCLDLGVEAITVYAFSIDNFRRGPKEVEALMELAEEKLLDLLNVCHTLGRQLCCFVLRRYTLHCKIGLTAASVPAAQRHH